MTDRQLRSVCTTTLATLRWTNTSPGGSPMISLAGTRLSEQPIHRKRGDCCCDRRSKNCGSSRRTCSDQALLLSKRCWRTRMPVILSWRAFRGKSPRAAGVSHTLGAIRDRPLPPDDREATMTVLLIGLILFLGAHSVRIVADDWRSARIAAMGEGAWKGVYSL